MAQTIAFGHQLMVRPQLAADGAGRYRLPLNRAPYSSIEWGKSSCMLGYLRPHWERLHMPRLRPIHPILVRFGGAMAKRDMQPIWSRNLSRFEEILSPHNRRAQSANNAGGGSRLGEVGPQPRGHCGTQPAHFCV